MPSSPRRVTILVALGSLILIALAATVGWKEIATQYHLFRLRRDPAYFRGILSEPEGISRRAAIRKYLESAEGKRALIRECLPPSRQTLLVGFTPRQAPQVYVYASLQEIKLSNGGGMHLWHGAPDLLDWCKLLHEYVPDRYIVTLPEYQGMEFEIRKIRDVHNITADEEVTSEPRKP
jgi:hypothetical protein